MQDTSLLDSVLQLRGLTSLRVSLHDNLLSATLQQRQVAALAQVCVCVEGGHCWAVCSIRKLGTATQLCLFWCLAAAFV